MRILYLQTFPYWGSGSGTYARHLASEIGKRHEVAMLAPDDRPIDNVQSYVLNPPFRVAFTGHPEWPRCRLFTDLTSAEIAAYAQSTLKQTLATVEEFKPDVIHVHHAFPLSWGAGFVKDTMNTPFIVTIHGSELPTLESDKRWWQSTYNAMMRSKRIVPNSRWTRDWFLKVFKNHFHEKCRVIPGGVNIKKFVYDKKGACEIDKMLGLEGKPVVLFAGKLTKYKGVEYLIKAADRIHGEIVIMGDGPDRSRLRQLARRRKANNIHWIGHQGAGVKKLVPFYSRADVFVAPSVWDEPLGLVILESMSCGTPVVVTRKGGIPLAVKEGVNGYFVRPRNSSQIVEKVNMLLDDEKKRKKMGIRAREIVENKFSWQRIGHKFELMYKRSKIKTNKAAKK